jgi:hypothetical protein
MRSTTLTETETITDPREALELCTLADIAEELESRPHQFFFLLAQTIDGTWALSLNPKTNVATVREVLPSLKVLVKSMKSYLAEAEENAAD